MTRECRLALRRLRARPGYALAVALTLGVGLGAVGGAGALVHSVLMRPLPFDEPDRLVALAHAAPGLGRAEIGNSTGTYLYYREGSRSLVELGLYHLAAVNLTGETEPERIRIALATPSVFSTLGVTARAGRTFTEEEGRPGAPVRVVLAHDLWERRYGADPSIVGRTVEVNGVTREVVGVMGPEFRFPDPTVGLWMNQALDPTTVTFAGDGGLFRGVVARLAPGGSVADARRELEDLVARLPERYPEISAEGLRDIGLAATVTPLGEAVGGDSRLPLLVLFAGACTVLLIAVVNAVNLLLVRGVERQPEFAIRRALGAGQRAFLAPFMAEAALLASLGCVLALSVASTVVSLAARATSLPLPRLDEASFGILEGALLGLLALGVGLALGLVAGLVTTGRGRSKRLASASRGSTGGPDRQRFARGMVASQVAFALVLVAAAALMARTGDRLRNVDPGFRAEGVLAVELGLPARQYLRYEDAEPFYRALLERVRALPGVVEVGAVSSLPLAGTEFSDLLAAVESSGSRGVGPDPVVHFKLVTPGYFQALGIPPIEGFELRPGLPLPGPESVLLSRRLAERLFPEGRALGGLVRRSGTPDTTWATVAGVVGDVRHESLRADPAEIVYVPMLEEPGDAPFVPRLMTLVVRSSVPPETVLGGVRQAVQELDPGVPLAAARTLEEILQEERADVTFVGLLLTAGAGVALLLAALGIQGLLAYAVRYRKRELAIRVALGATARDVMRMIVARGMGMLMPGIVVGTLATLLLTRFLGSLLYEVSPVDPWSFALAVTLLGAAGLAATWLPVRSAIRANPNEELRRE